MPTRAEIGHRINGMMTSPSVNTYHSSESWTDDLPVCTQTGVGFSTNQIYKKNGSRQELHPNEDKSFHFRINKNTQFYGLFDGYEGTKAAQFAANHLPAEVLLGQMNDREMTDEEIFNVLIQAFNSVEKEYFQLIADLLAEKASLEIQIQGMSRYQAYSTYPEIVERLKSVTNEVSAGTTAVVALIHCNRLHVANVGDSRAILCKIDAFGNYNAIQLSTDHDLLNDDELMRLSNLGLNTEYLRHRKCIGNLSITRCIGNYLVKGAYKDFDDLSAAKDEPVIAEPSIKGGIPIDDSCQFLILASGSLCSSLEEATGSRQVNRDIVQMVAEEFKVQNTLTGVAQAVVDKVRRRHQDQFFASIDNPDLPQNCKQIEDMTLMVRNFNYPLLNDISSPSSRSPSLSLTRRFDEQLSISVTEEGDGTEHQINYRERSASKTLMTTHSVSTVTGEMNSTIQDSETTTTTTTTNSTDFEERRCFDSRRADPLELDSEGKIAAYVQFDEFLKSIEAAKSNGNFSEFAI
jgi:TAK1-binding protein 1